MSGRLLTVFLLVVSSCGAAFGATEHATTILEAQIYLSPDESSQKMGTVMRGRDITVFEKSLGFVRVLAQVDAERQVAGWMKDAGVVRVSTPNAADIIFGEAADSEHEAEKRHGRRNSAQDAMRLYGWISEYLPTSQRAGEAMYRYADIRWQIEKSDYVGRPSNKEKDPYMRHQMEEEDLRKVEKKFPGTKWADLAAWDLIENKVCGEWQGDPKCPEKESEIYQRYVEQHPNSPKLSEAQYNAAWRQAALVDLYRANHDAKKSEAAKTRALQIAQNIKANDEFTAEGQRLIYLLQNNIPVYEYVAE